MAVGIERSQMRAPFPWFGGKMRVASEVWARLGNPTSYVEPFAGSLAVLLQRPGGAGPVETVNDADGLLVNFWRALQADPDGLAREVDWPVTELDLTARHLWLVERREATTRRLEADPEWYDLRLAGWWCWGICSWIGSGWCSGDGPWVRDGDAVVRGGSGGGVHRQLPHLGNAGRGVHRKLPHLGNAGRGVHRQAEVAEWLRTLSDRLRRVRVACGDWRRVVSGAVLDPLRNGSVAVLLDPPYPEGWDPDRAYAGGTSDVWHDAAAWAVEVGTSVKVALCGYAGAWELPSGWSEIAWKSKGGYGGGMGGDGEINQHRERVWFSPACVDSNRQRSLL